ncbi:MAG: ATP-binding protein [Tepidanaerobacteraceae bacterium]|jgi:signal transduction histidine kinase|nr:ATP-binding protein [Tepidanaerobacteraceae bacterium]
MDDGLQGRSNDFVNYARVYEETFTENIHSISDDPPIMVKEGKHLVFIKTAEDGESEDEPQVFDVTTSLVEGFGGHLGAIITYEDKSEREKLHKNVSKLKDLNTVEELAASAVHEIKNPIFSIRGFLRLLENSLTQDDKRREYTRIMIAELDRLSKLADDFLMLTKSQGKKGDYVFADRILMEVLKFFEPRFDLIGISCHFETGDEIAPVYIDADQLKQVFINIIQNAIDAMPAGGNIYVGVYSKNKDVIIEIKDEGSGIKKEDEGNIFKPFFTTKENGTGLGLFISKRIIRSYRGTIEFKSEEGHGATFIIKIPASSAVVE